MADKDDLARRSVKRGDHCVHVVIMGHAAALACRVVTGQCRTDRRKPGVSQPFCYGRPAASVVPGAVNQQEGQIGAHWGIPLVVR